MVIDKIQKEVEEAFGHDMYDPMVEGQLLHFVYTNYPGNYRIKIERYFIDFEFNSEEDEIFFKLKYA